MMKKKRIIDFRERVIIDKPLRAINKRTAIITSGPSRNSFVSPSFTKNIAQTQLASDDVDRNAPPPDGTMDHRGWSYGDLIIEGFAHQNIRKGRWENKSPSDLKWMEMHRAYATHVINSNKRWKIDRDNLWWCICRVCKTPFPVPISTQALGKIERRLRGNPCRECNPHPNGEY